MPFAESHWAHLQGALLLDVRARLRLKDKITFESVCTHWYILLGDQPVSGAWGDRFVLSDALWRITPGLRHNAASQHRQLRLLDSLVLWLRRRAPSFQAISLGQESRSHSFEVDNFGIAMSNWLLRQLEQMQGLPALELNICCGDGSTRFGAYQYRPSHGESRYRF